MAPCCDSSTSRCPRCGNRTDQRPGRGLTGSRSMCEPVLMRVHGVGLQVNPSILDLVDQVDPRLYNFSEVLCDSFTGPLDSGYVIHPSSRPLLEQLGARHPLLAHGNYGNEFGYDPIDETPGVLRHIAVAHEIHSPWYADHLFYGFRETSNMWSSPLQFSR